MQQDDRSFEKPSLRPTRNQMHPVKYDYADSLACTYFVSIIAACFAEFITYPLDLTKTRLQMQGEINAARQNGPKNGQYRGAIATVIGIVKEEGITKLWQGMPPALYRHVIYSGVRICCYDFLRKKLGYTESFGIPLWKSALCGVTSGSIAQYLSSPADLIKVQLQMEGKRKLMGLEPRAHGTAHAFKEVVRSGGVKALWKGSVTNTQRAALVSLGDLTTYDVVKHLVLQKTNLTDSHPVHILASVCAGFTAAVMSTPSDVVKTRVMNQPTDATGRGLLYKGSVDCLQQTIAKEGVQALYKGFVPCWIRMAPWSLTFWLSFEHIRSLIGASGY